MKLTRRELLAGAAAGAAGAAGVYELVDRLAGASPTRAAVLTPPQPEQHLLQQVRVVTSDGVEVLVPPLHHAVVTARVGVDRPDLRDARRRLEQALAELDSAYATSPAGLGVTVAWGEPYFRRLVPAAAATHLPHDRRADRPALFAAERFPSDPAETVLEANDVAILLRSDAKDHVDDALDRIEATKTLHLTSIRRGFAGGGFDGKQSLPKRLAVAAGVPGADLIPDTAELFLGFTSTQKASMGQGAIANFETLGYVDLRGGYFRHGTHMHLSHIEEDLEAWYLSFDFPQRVATAFRPGLNVPASRQTVPQGPEQSQSPAQVARTYRRTGRIGHSASLQTASRLQARHVGPDGTVYAKGTAIPVRADFNTLDHPFSWSEHPGQVQPTPSAGVHFVIFNPSSDDFRRGRLAMDGRLPNGDRLPFQPRANGQGFNAVLRTTHRQNFLVPPRRHRSFPLAEL
jgi:hypothetical protein